MKMRKKIYKNAVFPVYIFSIIVLIVFSCTFNNPEKELFEIKPDFKEGDTLSAYPEISFAFSEAVSDSAFSFMLSPDPGVVSYTYMNQERDTAFFSISGILSGNTYYTVTVDNAIISENGSKLLPSEISFGFYTGSTEEEPNNNLNTADSLVSSAYGVIVPADDIDIFIMNDPEAAGVYCRSESVNNKCSITVLDSNQDSLISNNIKEETDSLFFPDGFALPVVVKVNSYAGINNSKYHVGLIKH